MRNALWLASNTFKLIFRKKSNLIVFFILPVIGVILSLVLYGNAGSGSINLGVVDQDHSLISQDLIHGMDQRSQINLFPMDAAEISDQISAGKVDAVLRIPQGFADSILRHDLAEPELVSIKGQSVSGWVQSYVNVYVQNLLDLAYAAGGEQAAFNGMYESLKDTKLSIEVATVEDQAVGKAMTAQSIGFLIYFMMLGTGNAAELILKEKRNRTYYRISSAPVKGYHYIEGNVWANFIVVLAQAAFTILIMTQVMGIKTYIPFYELFVVMGLFGLVAIGLGLVIVAFFDDSPSASAAQNMIITPTCLLAGCFWPSEMMPPVIQKISDFLPQKWVLTSIQSMQEGSHLDGVALNLAIISAFALALFLIAAYRFNRNNNVKTVV